MIEVVAGPSQFGRVALNNMIRKSILKEAEKDGLAGLGVAIGGKAVAQDALRAWNPLEALGSSLMGRPIGAGARYALNVLGEPTEEILQQFTQDMGKLALSGKFDTPLSDYVDQAMAALPMGAIFGTMATMADHANDATVRKTLIAAGRQPANIDWINKEVGPLRPSTQTEATLGPEAVEALNGKARGVLGALQAGFAGKLTQGELDGLPLLVSFFRNLAMFHAVNNQKDGVAGDAAAVFDKLTIGHLTGKITEENMTELRSILNDPTRAGSMDSYLQFAANSGVPVTLWMDAKAAQVKKQAKQAEAEVTRVSPPLKEEQQQAVNETIKTAVTEEQEKAIESARATEIARLKAEGESTGLPGKLRRISLEDEPAPPRTAVTEEQEKATEVVEEQKKEEPVTEARLAIDEFKKLTAEDQVIALAQEDAKAGRVKNSEEEIDAAIREKLGLKEYEIRLRGLNELRTYDKTFVTAPYKPPLIIDGSQTIPNSKNTIAQDAYINQTPGVVADPKTGKMIVTPDPVEAATEKTGEKIASTPPLEAAKGRLSEAESKSKLGRVKDVKNIKEKTAHTYEEEKPFLKYAEWLVKQEALRKTTPAGENIEMRGTTGDEVAHSKENGIYLGLYSQRNRMILFMDGASLDTVAHEFLHHFVANGYLSFEGRQSLLKFAGIDAKEIAEQGFVVTAKETDRLREANERLAGMFGAYLRSGEVPEGTDTDMAAVMRELATSFNSMAGELQAKYGQNAKAFNTEYAEIKPVLDAFIQTPTQKEISATLGKAMAAVFESDSGYLSASMAAKQSDAYKTAESALNIVLGNYLKQAKIKSKTGEPMTIGDIFTSLQHDTSARNAIPELAGLKSFNDVTSPAIFHKILGVIADKFGVEFTEGAKKAGQEQAKAALHAISLDQLKEDVRPEAMAMQERLDVIPSKIQDRLTAHTGAWDTLKKNVKSGVEWLNAKAWQHNAKLAGITEILDDGMNGPFFKLIHEPIWNASKRLHVELERIQAEFVKLMGTERGQAFKEIQNRIDLPTGKTLTVNEIGKVYYLTDKGNAGSVGAAHLKTDLNSLTDQDIEAVRAWVEDASIPEAVRLKKLLDTISWYTGDVWPRLAAVYKSVTGKDLGYQGAFYTQFIQEGSTAFLDKVVSIDDLAGLDIAVGASRKDIADAIKNRYTQKRAKNERGKLSLDLVGDFLSYMEGVENYIAKAPTIQRVSLALGMEFEALGQAKSNDLTAGTAETKTVLQDIADKFGPEMAGVLREMIRREMSPSGRVAEHRPYEEILRPIRINATYALLGFRPTTILRTPISLLDTMSYNGMKGTIFKFTDLVMRGLPRFLSDTPFAGNPLWERLPAYLKRRYEVATWNSLVAQSQSQGFMTPSGNFLRINKWVSAKGMMGIRFLDMVTVMTAYNQAFEEHLDAHPGDVTGAGRSGERVVSETQPATMTVEKSLMQTGTEFERSLIPFMGQQFTTLNTWHTRIVIPLAKAYREAPEGEKLRGLLGAAMENRVARRVLFSMVLPGIAMGQIMRREAPDDPEEAAKLWAWDALIYPLTAIPVLGGMFQQMSASTGGRMPIAEAFWSRELGDIQNGLNEIISSIPSEDDTMRQQATQVKHWINGGAQLGKVGSMAFGFPSIFVELGRRNLLRHTGFREDNGTFMNVLDALSLTPPAPRPKQ